MVPREFSSKEALVVVLAHGVSFVPITIRHLSFLKRNSLWPLFFSTRALNHLEVQRVVERYSKCICYYIYIKVSCCCCIADRRR
jgi:hypothetical protein